MSAEKRLNELFEELVPFRGSAATEAGEIVRAAMRLAYRYWNDGDRIGVGYGNETCNAPARFLIAKCPGPVEEAVSALWGERDDDVYEVGVTKLEEAVVSWLDEHPELREKENGDDMLNYRKDEDTEYDEDEEYE